MTPVRCIALLALCVLIAGCGYKGDLVLPDKDAPAVDPSKDADATDVKKNPDT